MLLAQQKSEVVRRRHELAEYRTRRHLAGMVRDVVLIICGVLGAFAVDAWWDRASDRRAGGSLVRALATEFGAVQGEVEFVRVRHQDLLSGLEGLQRQLRAQGVGRDVGIPDSAVAWLFPFYTLDVPSGVLVRALATGEITLIRDESLQMRLAAWPSVVADVLEEEEVARSFVYERVVPALESDVSTLLSATFQEARASTGETALTVTPAILNLVAGRIRIERNTLNGYNYLESQLDSIRAALSH